MTYEEIVERLIEARQRRQIDRAGFAAKLGVSKQRMGHWEGLRNRASLEDLEAWAAQLGFKLIIGITTEDALQRAFSLDAELGKLPPERAALVVELAQALGELEERDFRLIRGVVRQVIDGDKADQALYGHRPGKSKPA